MRMGINEPGENRGLGEVNDFGSRWRRAVGRHRHDGVAFYDDNNVVERFVGFAVYEVTGSDGDGLFWRSGGGLLLAPGRSADCPSG